MAITKAELKQQIQEIVLDDRGWTWSQWNDECHRLSVHVKYDQQLIDLEVMYQNKLKRLYQAYQDYYDQFRYGVSESFILGTSEDAIADLKVLKQKFIRIARKWNVVKAEIRGREKGFFNRDPVGTTYYIDLDGGNDGNDGLSTGQAWLTLEKYTTVTARSAGDIAYVRANTDEIVGAADIVFDEDGDQDNYISIIGCDSAVNDPWSDGSDVKPVVDFNTGSYQLLLSGDKWWWLERLVVKNSTDGNGGLQITNDPSELIYLKDCEFIDNSTGLYVNGRGRFYAKGCVFKDNTSIGVRNYTSVGLFFESCEFDGGAGGQDYGYYSEYTGTAEFIDCDFGQTNAHGTDDIDVRNNTYVKLRNCKHNANFSVVGAYAAIIEEDADGVFGAQKITYQRGTITKDTGVTRSGGADSSAKMEPSSACGLYAPLTLNHESIIDYPFKIWCAASSTTITIYIRSFGAWSTYPTASELYIEASYLDHATNATRSTIASNDVLSDETTWVAFDVTFTPQQAGWVYVNVYLKKHEASKGCYVDVKPVVT